MFSYKYVIIFLFLNAVSCTKQEMLLFEDDFENHAVGKTPESPWKTYGNGQAFVDDQKAFSGKNAVHFVTGEGYRNRSFIGIDHIFPLANNSYYGSMNMYIEEASPDGIHWTMIQSTGKVPDREFSAEVRYGGQHQKKLMANYDTQGVQSDCWQHANTVIPEKEWFAVSWFFDGPQNTMKLWINDTIIEEIIVTGQGQGCVKQGTDGQWLFPVFENVLIGWVDYQKGGGTRHIWIDDVVISSIK